MRSYEIFFIFSSFLSSWVLSRSATCEATRIYQFVTNNHVSFHLWWKESLLNLQKISKYYEHDYSAKFSFAFYLIIFLDKTWKVFDTNLAPQWKNWESSYQVRQILATFCKVVALILSWNCIKGPRVSNIFKQIKI